MSDGLVMKRWRVSVTGLSEPVSGVIVAKSRGKALAEAWRSDVFNGYSFGEFMKMARAWREHDAPPRFGDPITIEGRPAHFVDANSAAVQFVYPGEDVVLSAHPYDVLPISYRPTAYQDRNAA